MVKYNEKDDKVDKKLHKSSEILSTIFKLSPDAIVLSRASNGIIIDCNQEFLNQIGYSREEVIGHTSTELNLWTNDERQSYFDRIQRTWTADNFEIRLQRKDGTFIDILYSSSLITIDGDKIILNIGKDITKRKKTEEQLKQSETRFSSVVKNSPDVIYRFNLQTGYYEYMSPTIRTLNFEPEELMAMSNDEVLSRVHPEDRPALISQLTQINEVGKGLSEYRFQGNDGKYRWWSNLMVIVKDSQGKPHYRDGFVRDVTEHKKVEEHRQELLEKEKQLTEELRSSNEELRSTTEELQITNEELQNQQDELINLNKALKESQERFFKAFHNNPAAMTLSDEEGRYVDVNKSFSKLTGYSKDELVDHTSSELKIIDTEKRKPYLTDLHEKGSKQGIEFVIKTKSGKKRTVISSSELVELSREIRNISFIYDITERQKAEEALKESEEKYRSIIENIQDAYMRGNNEGVIIMASPSAARMYGFETPEEMIGVPNITLYKNPKDRYSLLEELKKHGKLDDFESEGIRTDGTSFPVSMNVQFHYDDQDQIQGTEAFVRDITERKRLEKEHQQLAQQRQLALDAASMGWWHYDPITNISYYDEQYRKIFGVSGGQRPNDEILKRLHPEDLPNVWAKVEKALNPADPQPYSSEYRIFLDDGSMRWIEAHGIATFKGESEARQATSLVGTVADITERKKAEDILQTTLKRFYNILSSMYGAILLVADNNRVEFVNQAFCDYFDLDDSPEDLMRLNSSEMIEKIKNAYLHPEEAVIRISEIVNRGQPVKGEEVDMQGGMTCIRDFIPIYINENSYGRIWHHMDISKRKKAEEALRESEEKFRSLYSSMSEGVALHEIIYNSEQNAVDYIITDVNPTYENITGLKKSEVKGNKASELYGTGNPPYIEYYAPVAETGKPNQFETYFEPMDKDFRISVTSPEKGKFATIFEDITKRKRDEGKLKRTMDELKRSNKELEQFAYISSHDLQEPLRMVASFSQLLEQRYKDQLDEDANEFIEFIVDGAKRMKYLIDDLLAYSRVTSQAKEYEIVDLENVLETVLSNLNISIEENKATITHDPLPQVWADLSQMIQVFQNLIANAIKFRGTEPPVIHITAHRIGKEWTVAVADNGIGIYSDHQKQIFEVFKRLHTREEYPGTGIGLSIVQKIIERHEGRIWVESEEGKGSTFYFTIPNI